MDSEEHKLPHDQTIAYYREFLNAELNNAFIDINTRRLLILRYLILYALGLSALLSYTGLGIQRIEGIDQFGKVAFAGIGLLMVALIFFANICFNLFLSWNMRGMIISRKNIATIRQCIMSYLKINGFPTLLFCDFNDSQDVTVSKSYKRLMYWLIIVNFFVWSCSLYYLHILCGLYRAIEIYLLISALLILFYPRVHSAFDRYLLFAKLVGPGFNELAARKKHREDRNKEKAASNRSKLSILKLLYGAVITIMSLIFIGDIILGADSEFSLMAKALIVLFALSTILRFMILKWDLNVAIKPVDKLRNLFE